VTIGTGNSRADPFPKLLALLYKLQPETRLDRYHPGMLFACKNAKNQGATAVWFPLAKIAMLAQPL
jgi:hypothetical protein